MNFKASAESMRNRGLREITTVLSPQPPDILAVRPGYQADPAGTRCLLIGPEFTRGNLDE